RRHTRFSRDWSSDVCSSDLRDLCELDNIAQIDHEPAAPQVLAVVFIQDGATAGGQHDVVEFAQVTDGVALAHPEAGLALDIENPRDVGAGALLDDLVGVVKGQAQFVSEQATDSGLACSHGTDEKDVVAGTAHQLTAGP